MSRARRATLSGADAIALCACGSRACGCDTPIGKDRAMLNHRIVSFHGVPVLFSLLAGSALPGAAAADDRVSKTYGQSPLRFEANQGQTQKDVRCLSQGS